jgi:DNA-binding NarL/FixJ family response regulator
MESKGKITVLIVDDHPVFRRGLVMILGAHTDIEVVGEAADGIEAVEKASELQPSVVIMDIQMPRSNGVTATEELRKVAPNSKVLILTVSQKNGDVFEAMQAGAKGYLLKHVDIEELVAAVKAVAMGNIIISQSIAGKLIDYLRPVGESAENNDMPALSMREIEVLRLVASGDSNREVANQLSICEATVKAHLRNIMDKMQVKNRAQAVARAINNGVLKH